MIIQKIEIQNFRSYYKENVFNLTNGLNLIIGANGDGKTTFYEALEWLFKTDNTNKTDLKFISKKRCEELFVGDSDTIRVSMTYEHKGLTKILEKSFGFKKTKDGLIDMYGYDFRLIENNGIERQNRIGIYFDDDLSSDVRQYIMFKGEGDLDVFKKTSAIKMLVDTFGEVKDYDAYFEFMEYATDKAYQAQDNAQKRDTKNARRIKQLKQTVEEEKNILKDIESELQLKNKEAVDFESLLKNIEKSRESSELLKGINSRIENLTRKRFEKKNEIKENYSIKLLDDNWILLGFDCIAEEYSQKVSSVERQRRKMEQDYLINASAEKVIEKMRKEDFVPLPVHIPGQKIMQEMLDEEICKICGRPAKKHSEAWEYMLHRLEEYKESLKVKKDDEIPPLYQNNYIGELQKRDTILNDNLADVTKLPHIISKSIQDNNRFHAEVRKYDENINIEYENKKKVLSQSDGLTEQQLLANYENISDWTNRQKSAEARIKVLKVKREQHRALYEEAQEELNKLAEGTEAARFVHIWKVISRISQAFKEAKENNKRQLLHSIEDASNEFLDELNIDDFKGTIRIIEKANGEAEAALINNDGTKIFNPNTALRTTYLMSVLFAIGKIASKKKEAPYPLLFDAPTSSFTGKKEEDFFNVISGLKKQVIIVTKSFLKDDGTGNQIVDYTKVDNLKNARVFRIEKKKPFDDRKLGTIQTVVTQLN